MVHRAIKIVSLLLFVALVADEATAKRGCANFGHSCYGGIGKRSEMVNDNEEVLKQTVLEAENLPFMYPGSRNVFANRWITPQQYEEMNKIFKDLVVDYLSKEEGIEKK